MTASLTLTNAALSTSTAVRLLNGRVSYQWKNLTSASPANSKFGAVEVQSNGWENPIWNLTFHIPSTIPSGCMTWALWNEFVKAQSVTTTDTILNLTVGNGVIFADYSASTSTTGVTNIPVTVLSYGVSFAPEDSDGASHWTIDAQLQVTL